MASALLVLPGLILAQKKPLDHSVYDGWKSIRSASVSHDGKWVLFVIAPQEGDAVATIRSVADGHTITIPRASQIQFTNDSKHVVALVIPPFADTRKARRDKVKPEDMPKNALEIVDLGAGQTKTIDRVTNYQLAEEDSNFLLYKPEPPKEAAKPPTTPPGKKDEEEDQRRGGGARAGGAQRPAPAAGGSAAGAPPAKKAGDSYVLLDLGTGKEETINDVASARFNKFGNVMAYAVASKDGKTDGIVLYDLRTKKRQNVVTAPGKYPRIALSDDASLLAFTTDKDDQKAKKPLLSLYLYDPKKNVTKAVGADSMPKDWTYNANGAIDFSDKNTRLIYRTSPKPLPDPEEKPDDEKVSVDIWNWQDARLQPQQLLMAQSERDRGYTAIYDIASGKSIQVADRDLPSVTISDKGDGRYGLASDERPYEREGSWNPGNEDTYVIDLKTGAHTQISKRFRGGAQLSPSGRYVAIYDAGPKAWFALEPATGRRVSLSKGITSPLADELDDHPDDPAPYGLIGWTKGDSRAIIADRYDLWACDPSGQAAPVRLTSGREYTTRYRPVSLDPDAVYLDTDDMLLDAFNEDTKQNGLARLQNGHLNKMFMAEKSFLGYQKAKNADTLIYTRQDFVEYPDIWLSNTRFEAPQKISDANPQQKEYNWGKAELVRWTSLDGIPLQGILIKPENFDYGKKYPMITYFYERNSDELYRYKAPAPSASTINWPLFASNGYCIFIPDIPYKIGYPGESAVNGILPGVQAILGRGYIDPKRMGIQGQSWGGYQVAYLVTRTNMFAAAEAGAPVGDMFSAYGGIRYGAGIVRQFQYEHQQSRIGGTPWDATLKYIENSPIFWVDKVETPLMIMSNDKDGSVPHTQGIELFTALRRLNKPSWLVVYNGEDHNLMERKNRKDLSIRLSQFFDHYLKGAPMPVWMSQGVPAVDKGRTMGTELGGN
ncbi:alpha/beta hydrolase family protein [Fimbriimonas ginsengisoli]|uniref:Putative acylaminoacyl-peptidase n=1 Tax=Fimbriimonas ginsengisoli Gsoil 348 TaxID=661478 RepID=A0A068NYW7_FIMGI|nr:prolyl oligopeptidase family serine peptidase [Fimbriimonas ginsengisoli]AIE87544.1 putative acylaminoacyl-peptidase [Fimbriimonas ginsengisoli Gsoil 348]